MYSLFRSRGCTGIGRRCRRAVAGTGRPEPSWRMGVGVDGMCGGDLGPRYLAEGLSNSVSSRLTTYIGLILGVAVLRLRTGFENAHGPCGNPIPRNVPDQLAGGRPSSAPLATASSVALRARCRWASCSGPRMGVVLLVAVPRGLGAWLLGPVWRPAYPLLLPQILTTWAWRSPSACGTGLHALGAARQSLRAVVISSVMSLFCSLLGAVSDRAFGALWVWQSRNGRRAGVLVGVARGNARVWQGTGRWLALAGPHGRPTPLKPRNHLRSHERK